MPRTSTNEVIHAQEVSQAKPVEAKKHRPHLSSAKIVRIERRYLEGESNREIARAERCGRNTVARVVKAPELREHLERVRERIWGMADHAADVVLEAIVQKRDARISYELLRDVGVLPRASQIVQQPAQLAMTREERDDWQTRAIASVIAERRRVFGIELPTEMQQALDQANPAETEATVADEHPAGEQ
jgi:transposase